MTAAPSGSLSYWQHAARLCGLALLCAAFAVPASAQLGQPVTNIATVSYELNGEVTRLETNAATFTIEAARSESTVRFYRYAPGAPDVSVQVNGSDFVPAGSVPAAGARPGDPGDPFRPVGPPVTNGGTSIDLTAPTPLAVATHFFPGELIFVEVNDPGQNGDAESIETVVLEIQSPAGDAIVLRLYETGPDTGSFVAYVPTVSTPAAPGDAALTTLANGSVTATYEDPFDPEEVTSETALVDPFGRVFDSITGALLDGVEVTVVDAATGQPAPVFGLDGVSVYPSTVRTGGSVTDSGGFVYNLEPGQFFFPLMPQGSYRLTLGPLEGYSFASARSAADLENVPGGPFIIQPASYGEAFLLNGPEPVNFDVPVDPAGDLLLEKSVSAATASAGDTVGYTVKVSNRNANALRVRVSDRFPEGFRLVPGSVRLNGETAGRVRVSDDGGQMIVDAGQIAAGQSLQLTYALTVSAGARPGPAINRAVVVDASGNALSNAATASINVIEDLLRSRFTLVGRVVEGGCDGSEAWARTLAAGTGVAGVRVYLETGAYVVTDKDGLYHFEGVEPGTHVVQMDVASLPEGYEVMACEETTRLAGSAISAFVDARGGSVAQANFYLKRTGDVAAETVEGEADDTKEYLNYDAAWLAGQERGIRWIYPDTDRTPSSRSVNIGILHPADHKVELTLNGQPVPAANSVAGLTDSVTGNALSRWRGIDILPGENIVTARVIDANGQSVTVLTESIWHVSQIEQAVLVADQSVLSADGRTPPVIAVRLENAAGRPVHKGRSIKVDVSAPYQLRRDDGFEGDGVTTTRTAQEVVIGSDGIARIMLEPTLQTGRVRITVDLDDGSQQALEVRLAPEARDWIVVGLAEGSMGLADPDAAPLTPLGDMKDGRIAFFAKGMVKGDWLLTLAVDTAKRRGARDTELFEGYIDPNAYYTLYGDRTWQYSDAESRYPLYVKLEKDAVQLLFGDYNTDLGDQTLGRFDRRLSGVRVERQGRNISATGFAAETNQGFVRQELAADGTSGPYVLPAAPVVRNSEVITVETRDRVRPDVVLDVRTLARWLDYDLDFRTGELVFRYPVSATDAGFNPNVIVVNYEAETGAERNETVGGRVSVHTEDRRLEAGVTVVHEEGSPFKANARGELVAVDAEAKIDAKTQLKAEVATTSRDGVPGADGAEAFRLEAVYKQDAVTVSAYYHQEDAGFGLGQQSVSTIGVRRVGVDARARLAQTVSERTGKRQDYMAEGRAYREESLGTGAARDVSEATLSRNSDHMGLTAGLKAVRETFETGEAPRDSVLATGLVRRTMPDLGLTLTVAHEQPLSAQDEASLFPERTLAGLDKTLTRWATLNLRHEIKNGAAASGNSTLAGVTVKPWRGAEVRATADQVTQDSAKRLSATVGADQTIPITQAWSASFGAARRARIDGGDAFLDVTSGATDSALAGEAGYTSAHAGLAYRADRAAASSRIEYRDSELGVRWTSVLGAAREASETLSYAAAVRAETDHKPGAPDTEQVEARIGAAWRPRSEGAVIFARLDAKQEAEEGIRDVSKLVGNLAANVRVSERTQAAVNLGLKYQESDLTGTRTSGLTQLAGAEIRRDLTPRFDVGFAASALVDYATGTTDYAFGPSAGFTPVENVWVSVGYNFAGFQDTDFEGAEYCRDGAFIKVRVKFDQHTAEGLLKKISPN